MDKAEERHEILKGALADEIAELGDLYFRDAVCEVRVEYGETVSFGDYSNARISVTLVAKDSEFFGISDDEVVRQELMKRARETVYIEIDRALEARGLPPKYYEGPRFKVVVSWPLIIIAVLPEEVMPPETFQPPSPWETGLRLDAALQIAQKKAEEDGPQFTIMDLSDHEPGTPYPWAEGVDASDAVTRQLNDRPEPEDVDEDDIPL